MPEDPALPLQPDPEPPLPDTPEAPENSIPAKSLQWEEVLTGDGSMLYRVPVPGGWLYRCTESLLYTSDRGEQYEKGAMALQFVPHPVLDAHAAYIAQLDAELRVRRARSAAGMRVPGAGSA